MPNKTKKKAKIANVYLSCGRLYLDIAGIAIAMEGDRCRHLLPEEVAEPIPEEELNKAMIGDKPARELPLDVVRWFRGNNWTGKSLEWAAAKINKAVEKYHAQANNLDEAR